MRITAKEALFKTKSKLSGAAISNIIFDTIREYSEDGETEIILNFEFPSIRKLTNAMNRELFKFGDTYNEFKELFMSLGYNITSYKTSIKISWDETNQSNSETNSTREKS